MIWRILFTALATSFLLTGVLSMASAEQPDRLLADFEGDSYGDWKTTGTAFGDKPMPAEFFRSWQMTGYLGKGAVYSAPVNGGDGAVGTLTSPEFKIDRRYLNFLIGGGNQLNQTCLNLLVDGKVVQSVPGGEGNNVFWFSIDLAPWQGKTGQIQIVDSHSGGWGHVCVDQITLSDQSKIRSYPNPQMNQAMAALAHHSAANGNDSWRPKYHFHPQSGWMNDVNGPFYLNGYYHVFYQHHPFSPSFGKVIGWGHARSRDLVHWEQLPFAVWPEKENGEVACWSGGMAFDKQGQPVLFYTAVLDWPAKTPFVQSAAVPADADMIQWKKHPGNPLLPHHAKGEPKFDPNWRDPFGFKVGDRTFIVVGATKVGMPIYEAEDGALGKWAYRGFVFPEDAECPNFFKLGDKFVFLSSAFQEGVKYTVGTLDLKTLKYKPETRGVMDEFRNFQGVYGTGVLFDDKGRCIFLARAQGGRNGFNGYLILPRVLTLGDDGYLRQQPVPEIESLRDQHEELRAANVPAEKPLVLKTKGECLEIVAKLDPSEAKACGLQLRRSDDGQRFVSIRYSDGHLDVAGTKFPLPLEKDQPLVLRVFLDRIAMEVFVGDGRHVVTKSITPPETDLGVALFAEGGPMSIVSLDAWTMNPAPIVRKDDPPK